MIVNSGETLTRIDLERRRLAAARELLGGARQAHLVWKYRISRTTAMRWHRATREGGVASLIRRVPKGRPSRLNPSQKAQLEAFFRAGPRACGFDEDSWSPRSLRELINREFGVLYQPDYVRRLRNKFEQALTAQTPTEHS